METHGPIFESFSNPFTNSPINLKSTQESLVRISVQSFSLNASKIFSSCGSLVSLLSDIFSVLINYTIYEILVGPMSNLFLDFLSCQFPGQKLTGIIVLLHGQC